LYVAVDKQGRGQGDCHWGHSEAIVGRSRSSHPR